MKKIIIYILIKYQMEAEEEEEKSLLDTRLNISTVC
jgi:hypothetical protein